MARLVRLVQSTPIKIDPSAPPGDPSAWPRDEQGNLKRVSICTCGLSARFPFCDGAHKQIREDPGFLYRYDPVSRQVIDRLPDPEAAPPEAP